MTRIRHWLTLVVVLGLLLAACSGETSDDGGDEPTDGEEQTDDGAADESDDGDEQASGDRTQIRWFVGLGAGSDAEIVPAQEAVVEAFNASQDEIELVLEIVDNDQAFGVLNTQLAAGEGPDIVGPVGIRGRDDFPGAWLDLQPYVDEAGLDLSVYDPELVAFYEVEGEGLLGLPFAVYPQFMYYNQDLFDEAGLEYPPTAYGESYVMPDGSEAEWNIETVRELAALLTVDSNGNDATSADFDRESIEQFGFGNQWTDMRGLGTLFGPGALVDDEGNAQFPDHWRDAMEWYQALAWEDGSYPFADYGAADIFGGTDNWFNSGNMGMSLVHLWYATCCVGDLEAGWNLAPVPAANGQTTAKLHADTFAITEASEHPEEAFAVLQYMLGEGADELLQIYGGMPARADLQPAFFDALDEGQFSGLDLNWDVVQESLSYNDNPNHEAGLPNGLEAQDCYNRISGKLFRDPDFDVNAAIDQLVEDLQGIYDGDGTCSLEQ